MTTFQDLVDFFKTQDYQLILAADAEPLVHKKLRNKIVAHPPAGGVTIALTPIAKASRGIYIARAKSEADKQVVNINNEFTVNEGSLYPYTLKRLFFSDDDVNGYYFGYSNQILWPLCHIAFERPIFNPSWYERYKRVNEEYANAIKQSLTQKNFIWIHDYQLALVPKFLDRPKSSVVGLFWHIPWPTWEIFRILPQKKEILESLLSCDFIAFHRGYHVRNFFETVDREFEARIDSETNRIYYKNHITTVTKLPMGIDTDVISDIVEPQTQNTFLNRVVRSILNIPLEEEKSSEIDKFFNTQKVLLGVDRLDYTKGLINRFEAIDMFYETYPDFLGKVSYLGVLAPSREQIPSYKRMKRELYALAEKINNKYRYRNWQPIHLYTGVFTREEILNLYKKAALCLVTPLDDGMNLVSKEFVMSASYSQDPGMIVLSQFAGSAIDLTSAIIVNPYNINSMCQAIYQGLSMNKEERQERISQMASILRDRNVYNWSLNFLQEAKSSVVAAGIPPVLP